jgi:hypothetical protein
MENGGGGIKQNLSWQFVSTNWTDIKLHFLSLKVLIMKFVAQNVLMSGK